ncbi:class III poly(R)-hydroxyalkanoic acid synthase subunit PhaC [Coralloluteibacterium stylophorae]|uniref:Poly(3-hydroxyalkanoate) polymerase subunit PhaC n=1 Tax=Coralloluteibacterium stylophorae TaxID=1776034 RepID=A0AAP2CCR5_9GAMM|nr:class III poly(R)-hydroxyalkanoic acid synthase subunit PhaC [Coralloluteibacterium stylophorae]
MAGPLDFTHEALMAEMARLREKLAAGMDTLAGIGELDVGVTAREAVHSDGKMVLYRFRGERAPTAKVPLLIVYALVNRPYMTDLQSDRSLVRGLLARGEDVYIIDWGYPDGSDRYLTLEDYIQGHVADCVEHLRRRHGVDAIDMLGICQGGTFALCYAALNPGRVRNLVTMVTPVDFHTEGNLLAHWARGIDIDLFVDTLGNVPADLMNWTYLALKPWRLMVHKYVQMTDILDDVTELENFLRMEKWIFDSPDLAGEAFRQFIRDFYQRNGLVEASVEIGGEAVDLARIDVPVLNIYAEHDHLVPPASSRALGPLLGTRDYTEFAFRSGHIGIYVSGRAQKDVPQAIHDWLRARDPDSRSPRKAASR